MRPAEVSCNVGNRARLRGGRREGNCREEFPGMSRTFADGERGLCIVFCTFFRASDLYREYFFEGESFARGFGVFQVIRLVDIEKCSRYARQVVTPHDIGGNRILHRLQYLSSVQFFERMAEPQ